MSQRSSFGIAFRPALAVVGMLLACFSMAQPYYKLVRTEVVTEIVGKQPATESVDGLKSSHTFEMATSGFTAKGTVTVQIPTRIASDQESFSIAARLSGSWSLKATTTNVNLGLNVAGVPRSQAKGDPGPWLEPGSHSLVLENRVETSLGGNQVVRKWSEGGKRFCSLQVLGHVGVVQTLSGFRMTFVYEWTPDTPELEKQLGIEVLEVKGDVELSPRGNVVEMRPLKAGEIVKGWDGILTGINSSAKLKFPDGSIVVVGELTDLKVAAFESAGSLVAARIWLRGGQVAAEVNRASERPSDFHVKTPAAVTGSRGTKFMVRHDKLTGLTTIRVTEGLVSIVPTNPSLQEQPLAAGRMIDVSFDRYGTIRN